MKTISMPLDEYNKDLKESQESGVTDGLIKMIHMLQEAKNPRAEFGGKFFDGHNDKLFFDLVDLIRKGMKSK